MWLVRGVSSEFHNTKRAMFACLLLSGCGGSTHHAADLGSDLADLALSGDLAGTTGSVCDAYKQTGCIDGFHCTVATLNGTAGEYCIPNSSDTPIAEGQDCTAVAVGEFMADNCAAGSACIAYGPHMRCQKLCLFRRTECTGSEACVAYSGSPTLHSGRYLYSCAAPDNCDPIAKSGCTDPFACYLSNSDTSGRITVCLQPTGKNLDAGGECTSGRDCNPGEICAGLGFCRQLCDQTAAASSARACPSPLECMVDSGNYGACE